MFNRFTRRLAAALVCAASALAVAAPTALAAPPGNDDIGNAQIIAAVPARFTVDTREATSEQSEPEYGFPCLGPRSIWYRFTPRATVTAAVSTLVSDFNTMVGVFTGEPGALTSVACNNDIATDVNSVVQVTFAAGTPYFIAMSSCCDPGDGNPGGHGVLRLYHPRRPQYQPVIAGGRAGDASGRAFVRGSLKCANPSLATTNVTVSQRVGDLVARGSTTFASKCGRTPRRWSVAIDSDTDVAFRPRRAAITVKGQADDGLAVVTSAVERVVVLRNSPRSRTVVRSRTGSRSQARTHTWSEAIVRGH